MFTVVLERLINWAKRLSYRELEMIEIDRDLSGRAGRSRDHGGGLAGTRARGSATTWVHDTVEFIAS